MPQHTKQTRLRRKDLRQPDEFTTLTGQAMSWVTARQRLVMGVGIGVLAVALLLAIAGRIRAGRHAAAAEAFRAAYASFEAGKFPEAAEAFQAVARDYPSAPFGRLAALYQGHAVARQANPAAAVTAYSEYLATSPEPPYMRQEALTALGHAKEDAGDAPGALAAYTEAASLEGPYGTDARLNAARLHEALGHADQAQQLYAALLKDASDPDLRALLRSKVPPTAVPEERTGTPPGALSAAEGNVR